MQKPKKKTATKFIGNSKYRRKMIKRRREALDLKLPSDTPYPIIWAHQE